MGQQAGSGRKTTSSAKDTLEVTASDLCPWDPLATVLTKADERSGLLLASCAFGANLLLGLIPGIAVSILSERAGLEFLTIGHVRELPWALFSQLGIAPAIWIAYARQPRWILRAFGQLDHSGVLVADGENITLEDFVRERFVKRLDSALLLFAALTAGVITVVVAKLTPYWSGYPSLYGYSSAWWLVSPTYHWALWVPLFVFLPGYTVMWMVIRQAVVITGFGELYSAYQLVPKPFHPDRCNGLAPVGTYAICCTSVAVLFGIWLLGMITFPMLCGEPLTLTYVTIIPLLIYPALIPALLIPPVWASHEAMGKAKARALEGVAAQIRDLLSETQYQWMSASMTLVRELEEKYELMDKRYRTWPFDVPQLKGFSIAASIPWLTSVGTALLRVYLGTPPA